MRRFTFLRSLALTATCAIALMASSRILLADDAPSPDAKEPVAETPAAEDVAEDAPEAPAVKQAEPELFEDVKLIKVDATAKMVTVLIPPTKEKRQRAYRKLKLAVDDNTLIMLDQQPSTMAALQEGMIVNISHIKKGKTDTVDTIIVRKAEVE